MVTLPVNKGTRTFLLIYILIVLYYL